MCHRAVTFTSIKFNNINKITKALIMIIIIYTKKKFVRETDIMVIIIMKRLANE